MRFGTTQLRETRAKEIQKNFKKPLDKKQILCYNKDVKKRKETSQTRKAKKLKKATYSTILSLISNIDTPEAEEVRTEINAELARGQAKSEENRRIYAELHDKVMNALALADKPCTAQEIADEIKASRNKISYGLRNYWGSEVIVESNGKANTYRLA